LRVLWKEWLLCRGEVRVRLYLFRDLSGVDYMG